MNNIIIMSAIRIATKKYTDDLKLEFEDFDIKHIRSDILPLMAVQLCDVLIITDRSHFKVLKCRVPNVPVRQMLPISYLAHTLQLIEDWQ